MNSKSKVSFIESLIAEGQRSDGRDLLEMRNLRLVFNQTNDGCEVSLGKTVVFCKVSAKITEPSLAKPSEGSINFMINLRVAQESSQAFSNQKSIQLSNELSKYLERNIKGSKYAPSNF